MAGRRVSSQRASGKLACTVSAWLRHSSAPRGLAMNQSFGAAPSSTARVSAPPPNGSDTTRTIASFTPGSLVVGLAAHEGSRAVQLFGEHDTRQIMREGKL